MALDREPGESMEAFLWLLDSNVVRNKQTTHQDCASNQQQGPTFGSSYLRRHHHNFSTFSMRQRRPSNHALELCFLLLVRSVCFAGRNTANSKYPAEPIDSKGTSTYHTTQLNCPS